MKMNSDKLKPIMIDGVMVMGVVGAAKLIGVRAQRISVALKNGHKCHGHVIERGDMAKVLLLSLFLFVLPFRSFAQKTQYANYVTSTQQDTSVNATCILQTGDVTLIDSTLIIDGVVYNLHADTSFTDWMDFTDTCYNKYTITIRQYPQGNIEQIIIQDADDNSKSYCLR